VSARLRELCALAALGCGVAACTGDVPQSKWLRVDGETCAGAFERGNQSCYELEGPPAGDEELSGEFWPDWERVRLNMLRPRCDGVPNPSGLPQTPGTLAISLTTRTTQGRYAPANSGALWIESVPSGQTEDPPEVRELNVESGDFVRSLEIWAITRRNNLLGWTYSRCAMENVDAITTATLPDHSVTHELVWDGTDFVGNVPPDGEYVVWLELTENEIDPPSEKLRVIFTKGAVPSVRTRTDLPGVESITLIYTPSAVPEAPAMP
jgi:hypothetical protein